MGSLDATGRVPTTTDASAEDLATDSSRGSR
jgi:hypothetical protein